MKPMLVRISLAFIAGVLIGWLITDRYYGHKMAQFAKALSPEIQKLLNDSLEFTKGMTKEDFEKMMRDIHSVASRYANESNAATLQNAILAIRVNRALTDPHATGVNDLIAEKIQDLHEAVAAGCYKGTELEKLATATVKAAEREVAFAFTNANATVSTRPRLSSNTVEHTSSP